MFKTALVTLASLSALCLCAGALAASTDMSAGERAKLSKERAKSSAAFGNAIQNGSASLDGEPSSGQSCSLDIGNVNTGGRNAPREVNVFITGDVIQANRNCR